jgi:hypothetical protein
VGVGRVIVIDFGELVKFTPKGGVEKGVGVGTKWYGGCWVLWHLCVFGCISVFVVEGACVRACRGWGCV